MFVDMHGMFGLAYQQWQFQNKNVTAPVQAMGSRLLEMIQDMDGLLGTNPNYLFGQW